ncbi:MAG: hypothetical protein H7A45_21745 [Verrucomicrobiales bacterium]|nr:hypothetical protein [Verrucomicrobiales bacterium]
MALLTVAQAMPPDRGAGGVQADAVIRLEPAFAFGPVTLFARYWVATNYYHLGVVWAEPHGTGLWFPLYPPTLVIGSDDGQFVISHGIYPAHNAEYSKPVGEPGPFRSFFGAYPVGEARYADREARLTRLFAAAMADFPAGRTTNEFAGFADAVAGKASPERVRLCASDGRVEWVEFLDAEDGVRKRLDYEWVTRGGRTVLGHQFVSLAEEKVLVELPGEGVRITLDDEAFAYDQLQVVHRSGGRKGAVHYEPVALGGSVVSLPFHAEILGATNNTPLRSVTLTNYQRTNFDSEAARSAAVAFAGFSPELTGYRRLLEKYWQQSAQHVLPDDVAELRRLRSHFEAEGGGHRSSLGEDLRRLNVLMEINRLLGDVRELDRWYEAYLARLVAEGLFETVLVGGGGVIETAMLWGRTEEATSLLHRWADVARGIPTLAVVKKYLARELLRGQFWPAIRVIERLAENPVCADGDLFELACMKCVGWNGLVLMLRDRRELHDLPRTSQSAWVLSSVTLQEAEARLMDSVAAARSIGERLVEMTPVQRSWKAQLDSIGGLP